MFYSHTFLARKSPLGIVWIAAHLDHKLKRPQIESINIPSYAEKIMMPDVPIALRLSGHLLIGIVRIYSWKVNHVYSDCNKLISYIRKAFASVTVDLPIEADHAPFESVTLPETFDLNTIDLDESYYRTDEPDKHVKSYNQITMTDQIPVEEEQYVAVCINEENGLNLSPRVSNGLNLSPQPTNAFISTPQLTKISPVSRQLEDDTLPPFERSFESILSPQEHNLLNVNAPTRNEKNTPQRALDIEKMLCDPDPLPLDLSATGGLQIGQDSSPPINKRQSLSTIPENISILERDSSHGAEQLFNTSPNKLNIPDLEASAVIRSPVLNPKPAPPVKRRDVKKRKRIQAFDKQLVLSNMQMKKQLGETANIFCKRRKLPCSDLAVWKLRRFHTKEDIFDMPLLSRMSTSLVEALERIYPCSVEATAAKKEMRNIMLEGRAGDNMEDLIPQFTPNESGLGSVLLKEKNSGTLLKSANEISSSVEPLRPNLETPPFHLREHHLDDTEVTVPGLLDSANEDLNFLNANDTSPGLRDAFDVENLSSRTRAAAKYFKDNSLESESHESGRISLNLILQQKTRSQCSRMLFEILVLKSYNFINVEQGEPYGDILISPTPTLFSTKF